MTTSKVVLSLAALVIPVLFAGCASTNPQQAFSDVEKTVAARAGTQVQWIRSTKEDEAVARALENLLKRELTADDAVQIALLNNREMQATFEEIGIAQADFVQAGLLKNPSFSVHAGFPDKPPPSYVMNYSAAMDFLQIVMLPLRKKIAAQQLEATKLRVSEAVLKLAADVKSAYYTLQAREQLLDRLRKIEEINEAAAQLAQKQLEAGTLNELDSSNQQALHKQSRRDTAQAVVEARVDRERLNRLMGLWGTRTDWKIAHQLPAIPQEEIPLERLESLAIQQRLDVEAARRDVQLVGRALALRNGTRFFPAGIHIGVDSEREPEVGGPRTTGPTLEIEVPIFDQGQADVPRLRAQLRQAERRLEALATDARSEVREQRDLMIAHRDLAEYYGKVLLPLRGKILGLTLEHYNFMLKGTYDLLLAKQQEAETEREYIEAWRDYWIARTELERAVGGKLPGMDGAPAAKPATPAEQPKHEHKH